MTAIWVILAFLLGWKVAGMGLSGTVHQAIAQTSDSFWSAAGTAAWHVALVGAGLLALAFLGSLLVRRIRRNVFGR